LPGEIEGRFEQIENVAYQSVFMILLGPQGNILMTLVSRDGLITLKSMRGSGQDLDDIRRLKEENVNVR